MSQDNDYFKNKTVWVTGASAGIGASIAFAYNAAGASLIISARNQASLQEVKAQCRYPDRVEILPLDLSDFNELDKNLGNTQDVWKKADILVNNAGISQRSYAVETKTEVDLKIIQTNLVGTIQVTKALLPFLFEKKGGAIINISSVVGKFGSPLRTSYAASKHGLHGFFDSLRAEVWKHGIQVLMVCPGFIRTNVSVNALTGDGSPQNKMDDAQKNGLDPDILAQKIIKAHINGKTEIYVGGKEIIMIYLKRYVPGLYNRLIRNLKVT